MCFVLNVIKVAIRHDDQKWVELAALPAMCIEQTHQFYFGQHAFGYDRLSTNTDQRPAREFHYSSATAALEEAAADRCHVLVICNILARSIEHGSHQPLRCTTFVSPACSNLNLDKLSQFGFD